MSVASYFSKNLITEINKIDNDFDKCKELSLNVKTENEITLIYIYLYLCKLTDNLDIKYHYSRKANKLYLKYFYSKSSMLNEFEWTELELHKYDLSQLFYYDVFCLSNNVEVSNGRCIFKQNDVLIYRYQVINEIGKGTYSNVYKCLDYKKSRYVAIKAIRNDSKFEYSGLKEVNILKKLNHTSICNYIKYFQLENHQFIVFNLLKNNMYKYMKSKRFTPLKPKIVKQIVKQIIPVLVYIKSINIIHADIKPENILIEHIDPDTIVVKLSDFGSALKKHKKIIGYIVSRYYRAPEIVLEQQGCCDYPIDMWSFSTIIYEFLTGYPLFPSRTETILLYDIFKELGFPDTQLLETCKERNKLESQINNKNCCLVNQKLSKIKYIDETAYDYLIDTIKWDKTKRRTCNDAMNHSYLLEN
tara:strand:- start:259 stop:1506 length:1248 start_codon:yes stop_codon:yes gene_type:complete